MKHTSVPHHTLKLLELQLNCWATTIDSSRSQVGSLNDDNKCRVNWLAVATTDHQILLTVAQTFPSLKKQHYLEIEKKKREGIS